MQPGDYIESKNALIIRELNFKQYCDKHDDLMLEYDVDELWESWGERGKCFEALHEGRLVVVWEKRV